MDLSFWVLIASIFGSRLLFIVVNPDLFLPTPLELFRVWNGGFIFYGGLFAGMVAGSIYVEKTGVHLWKTADIMPLPLAAGQFFASAGCLFTGGCFGKVCGQPWAITFLHPDSIAPVGIPLHPTQIYMLFGLLVIFGTLLIARRYRKFDGQIFWIYMIQYGILRTIIDFFRDDRGPSLFGGLFSFIQLTGVIAAVWGVCMILKFWPSKEK